MSLPKTPDEFREQLSSGKHTLHELRMKLQHLERSSQADALLGVFNGGRTVHDQEIAGRLLAATRPKCHQPLDSILRAVASSWNASVEQLPIYLRDTFGSEAVEDAVTRLLDAFPADSREAEAMKTIQWWISGRL